MANPNFEGFTGDGRPYSMTRVAGEQDVDTKAYPTLTASTRSCRSTIRSGRGRRATGTYDRTANTLDVTTEVPVTTQDGLVAKLKSAYLDITTGA